MPLVYHLPQCKLPPLTYHLTRRFVALIKSRGWLCPKRCLELVTLTGRCLLLHSKNQNIRHCHEDGPLCSRSPQITLGLCALDYSEPWQQVLASSPTHLAADRQVPQSRRPRRRTFCQQTVPKVPYLSRARFSEANGPANCKCLP